MKKFLTLMVALLVGIGAVSAADRISRNINDLPAAARTTLNTHFKKIGVNHIKIDDKFLGSSEYDVVLNDGTEIDFDGDGRIKEIDRGTKAVPAALIPAAIRNYVSKNFKKAVIVQFEVKSNGYEIGLNNGADLEFDRAGNFKKIDY